MLKVFVSGTSNWDSYTQYGSTGLPTLEAAPSAVNGYNDTYADLVNNGQYLNQSTGLVTTLGYYTTTTATSTTPGGVAGYLQEIDLRQGEAGAAVPQLSQQYIANTPGSMTYYLLANQTVYRNPDGTGGEQTQYAYTFFSGTNQVQQTTITYPTVTTAENGPGTADQQVVVNDIFGRPVWSKDADGFIGYTQYDLATGGVTKTIADVDTTRTSDFSNLPTGWTTPTGGGLHLITQYVVDGLGRPTTITDPKGNVTYIVYKDTVHETRVYPGWDTGSLMPTGPTQLVRDDRGNGYLEVLTMSATPAATGGVPNGTEAIGSLQTDTRQYRNNAGQLVNTDSYFNLGGLIYTTSTSFGTLGTNFYRTLYNYDSRGRQNKVTSPTGTIYRTDFDGLDRPTADWVGTSDPSNMVQTHGYVYDGGGVGDSNLTAATDYPGLGAAARETDSFYDWRDRLVATKDGVQATESTTVHRPIMYYELDNLGEITATNRFDGDGVTITSTNGVPNKPAATLLRARATASYDEQARLYRTNVFSVDQTNGTISTNSLQTDTWFNHRGLEIKATSPGGLSAKYGYDGAGRNTIAYLADATADTTWADAGSVGNNAVMQQTENTFDADGNVTEATLRRRFHDQTGTGTLGTPTTGVLARVSYMGYFYDKANRETASVNVGTNGGTAWTTPSSVPPRSDTVLVSSQTYTAAGWVQDVTDPRGLVTDNQYDNLGRVTQTIQAYDGGARTDSTNKTTQYAYDGSNHLTTLTALLPGTAQQQTKFNYGVTTAGNSAINSNDVLGSVDHPDPTTGLASSAQRDSYTVDGLAETVTFQDRDGNVHTYSYDVLARETADAITTLGTGVDGTVRRAEIAYDTQGNAYLFTNFNQASGGTAVNQVKRVFNNLGQLTGEYQEHGGTVTGSSLEVQYAYTEMAGGVNNSRLTTLTYPSGQAFTYNYASGVDSNISRLTSISDLTGTIESYAYLGLDTVVRRSHPVPGVDLTYIKQTGESTGDAGDQYTGLDRFDRIVDQRWLVTSSGTATDRFQYGYDRDGNRLYRDNKVNSAFGELYHVNGANGYDNLNQLAAFARGTLSASVQGGPLDTIASPSHSQSWSLDVMGNFKSQTSDGTQVNRTHNMQNEVTTVGASALTFDKNGNMTTDEAGKTLLYDAWNRLLAVKTSGGALITSYGYDALSRRIKETPAGAAAHDLYYSAQWQVLEDNISGSVTRYVWSPVYVDALILSDQYTVPVGPSARYYVQQDANFNVTAILDPAGNVLERYVYDPYGKPTFLSATWATLSASAYGWQYLHQGGRYDPNTGLYLFRNRDLSPTLGRWIENDPMSFAAGDTNLYRFVGNNPANVTDPNGMDPPGWGQRLGNAWLAGMRTCSPIGWVTIIADPQSYVDQLDTAFGGSGSASRPLSGVLNSGPVAGTVDFVRSEPGLGESLVPIYGSARNMAYNLDQGNYGWAAFYAANTIADAFLVRSLLTSGWRLGRSVVNFRSAGGGGTSVGGWSWSNWFRFWRDGGGATRLEPTGRIPFFRRFRVGAYVNRDLPGTPGYLDTAVHEGTHIVIGRYFPQIIDAGRIPVVGGPINFVHEIIAHGLGRLVVGRVHALPLVPWQAFRGLDPLDRAGVLFCAFMGIRACNQ